MKFSPVPSHPFPSPWGTRACSLEVCATKHYIYYTNTYLPTLQPLYITHNILWNFHLFPVILFPLPWKRVLALWKFVHDKVLRLLRSQLFLRLVQILRLVLYAEVALLPPTVHVCCDIIVSCYVLRSNIIKLAALLFPVRVLSNTNKLLLGKWLT